MKDLLSYVTDVAVIVGSLGTAGALIVAAWEYRRSGEARRRQQASKVFALPVSIHWAAQKDKSFRWEPFDATVTNVSDMPVMDVVIALLDYKGDYVTDRVFWTMSPHSESTPVNFPSCAAAPPGPYPEAGAVPLLRLTFTDSAGLRWVREPDGELREVK